MLGDILMGICWIIVIGLIFAGIVMGCILIGCVVWGMCTLMEWISKKGWCKR